MKTNTAFYYCTMSVVRLGAILLMISVPSYAKIILIDRPIKIQGELNNWTLEVKKNFLQQVISGALTDERYTEVREVLEIPGTYLSMSLERMVMNRIFTRASIYSEGGLTAPIGSLVGNNHDVYLKFLLLPSGHDIKGSVLVAFFSKIVEMSSRNASFSLNNDEDEFYQEVLIPLQKKGIDLNRTVFIASSVSNTYRPVEVVGHEILHAQYFLNAKFRKAIDYFWEHHLGSEDKRQIKAELGKGYNTGDGEVVKNEFNAYFLQPDAGTPAVIDFSKQVPTIRPKLLEFLKQNDVLPVQAH